MSTLHLILTLALGKTFVDEKNHKVTLVREFTELDADFVQGFRFRGDNKTNYTADGGVVGHLGQIEVKQVGAYPLVREYVEPAAVVEEPIILTDTTLTLKEGGWYRNGLGQPILIIGMPAEDSRMYRKGYRFFDQQGTYYKPNGKVDQWPWAALDIVFEITPESEQITDEELVWVMAGVNKRIREMGDSRLRLSIKKFSNNAFWKTGLFCKKALPGLALAESAVATGSMRAGRTKESLILAGLSLLTFAYDKKTGSVSQWEEIVQRNLID